jgi:hypothetical protein
VIPYHLTYSLCDTIQPSKDPLEVPVGPVTRFRAKKFKEAFNGLLQDTWAKVDFKRICNNKEQALINLIHVQVGACWWNHDHYTRIRRRRLDSDSLTFRYSFSHNWSYRSNFDVILIGMETTLPYLSNGIWHAF